MRFWTTDWSYNDFFNGLECSVNFAMKLSEKGFEQASERGFGRCSVPKSAHPDPREAPVRAPPGLFRQFHNGVLRSSPRKFCRFIAHSSLRAIVLQYVNSSYSTQNRLEVSEMSV